MANLAASPPPLRDRRVLVVEDEWFTAEDVRAHLEELGAAVVGPAPSVARAVALIRAQAPLDAAVLDINLGGEMAFPVAVALRDRGVPFLFATGYDAGAIPQAYAGVPRCEKPFDARRCLALLLAPEGTPR